MLRGESATILRELFEFSDLNAGEIMVPRVLLAGIPVGAEPDELRAIVRTHAFTRYPVYAGDLDHIVGSLHMKQVLRHLLANQPISERDARPVPYVPGPTALEEVHEAMRRFSSQMAVVMDQHGGTAGIVTMEDLFEVIVGEIEEGPGRTTITREAEGWIRVPGTVRLKDAGDALGRTLDHPKVTTVSGLVLVVLGRPAQLGDVITWKGVQVEVTEVAGRGVREARLTAVQPS
jgi:CBS domain containing-hemolysin-like protein